jgi:hypothetical protein
MTAQTFLNRHAQIFVGTILFGLVLALSIFVLVGVLLNHVLYGTIAAFVIYGGMASVGATFQQWFARANPSMES